MKNALVCILGLSLFSAASFAGEFTSSETGHAALRFKNDKGTITVDISGRKLRSSFENLIPKVSNIGQVLVIGRVVDNKNIDPLHSDSMQILGQKAENEINKILDDSFLTSSQGEAKLIKEQVFISSISCSHKKSKKLFKEAIETTECDLDFVRSSTYELN